MTTLLLIAAGAFAGWVARGIRDFTVIGNAHDDIKGDFPELQKTGFPSRKTGQYFGRTEAYLDAMGLVQGFAREEWAKEARLKARGSRKPIVAALFAKIRGRKP